VADLVHRHVTVTAQLVGVAANGGCRQSLHESLAVISHALLDGDEKMANAMSANLIIQQSNHPTRNDFICIALI
jgi:hypothetical protein